MCCWCAAHRPVTVHGEARRRTTVRQRATLPVPAAAWPRLLPPAPRPAPRCQAAEPAHQRDGRAQTC